MGPKPKRWLEVVLFGGKSPCWKRGSVATFGIHSHRRGCNFRLEWFVWIHGTQVTCPTPRFGDGGHARCSMGSKRSLERIFFSLKSPCLGRFQRHVLGLQCHSNDCTFDRNDLYRSMGPGGHVKHLVFVMMAMSGAQWVQNNR